MRDIIFRGKRKDTGEWFEGYHVCIGETYHYICTGKLDISGVVPTFEHYLVYPETVGQDTGLIDKNGQKIFEGDIVLYDNSRFFVKYTEGFAAFSLRDAFNMKYTPALTPILAMRMEVIGNIHDSPELLEVK